MRKNVGDCKKHKCHVNKGVLLPSWILPLETYQYWSEISSETFTQRTMRRIGTGSLHSNSSVNGASVCVCLCVSVCVFMNG